MRSAISRTKRRARPRTLASEPGSSRRSAVSAYGKKSPECSVARTGSGCLLSTKQAGSCLHYPGWAPENLPQSRPLTTRLTCRLCTHYTHCTHHCTRCTRCAHCAHCARALCAAVPSTCAVAALPSTNINLLPAPSLTICRRWPRSWTLTAATRRGSFWPSTSWRWATRGCAACSVRLSGQVWRRCAHGLYACPILHSLLPLLRPRLLLSLLHPLPHPLLHPFLCLHPPTPLRGPNAQP